jgi:hypothetical protein
MNKWNTTNTLAAGILSTNGLNTVYADDVKILAAEFHNSGGSRWSVNVTLKHGDTGWDHYADNWRVVDGEGNIAGERVLYHPHVNEQPFTRSLSGVKLLESITTVYIEAHDKVHGWTPSRLKVDFSKATGGRLRIEAE